MFVVLMEQNPATTITTGDCASLCKNEGQSQLRKTTTRNRGWKKLVPLGLKRFFFHVPIDDTLVFRGEARFLMGGPQKPVKIAMIQRLQRWTLRRLGMVGDFGETLIKWALGNLPLLVRHEFSSHNWWDSFKTSFPETPQGRQCHLYVFTLDLQ